VEATRENLAGGTEQVPDPVAAQAAAREARRMLAVSRWPVLYVFGGLTLIYAAILALWPSPELAWLKVEWWIVVGAFVTLQWPLKSRQLGKRQGGYGVPKLEGSLSEEPRRAVSIRNLAIAFLALALLAVVTAAVLLYEPRIGPLGSGELVAVFCGGTLAVWMVYKAAALGLWEFWYGATVATALPVVVIAVPGIGIDLKWLLPLSALSLLMGVSFRRRWMQWRVRLKMSELQDGDANAQEANHA
jgi:hypothetical protein